MILLDWSNPKITIGELELFLANYLGTNYDGITLAESKLTIMTFDVTTAEQETYIKDWFYSLNDQPQRVYAEVQKTPPYAEPDYRTKLDATSELVVVSPGGSNITDYRMVEERYISGGQLVIKGAVFGDWFSAEVRDIDGVIPASYRASLCENWPIVAKYITRRWVTVGDGEHSVVEVDTRPLNAKITANLYLRITYNAVSGGGDREIAMNYDLTKKL